MLPASKSLGNSQQILSSPSKESDIHLPSLYKNHNNKTSNFASNSKLGLSKISQLSKSNFIGYENKSYQQKINERIKILSCDEYNNLTTGDIYKEYSMLKQQLKNMGEQLNRVISYKNFNRKFNKSSTQKGGLSKTSSYDNQMSPKPIKNIYQGFQVNNSKIFEYNNTKYNKLKQLQVHILQKDDPLQFKKQLQQKIIQAKQQLQKQKKNYKLLLLQSEKVGNDILNTDKLIEEIRLLQDQLNILLLRKKRLQQQAEINNSKRQKVQQGKAGIFQKEYELQQFQQTKKQKASEMKSQKQLYSEYLKKQRIIAALKKDKQARNKIKSKQYYQLLTQLNGIQQNQESLNKRYDQLQKNIQRSKNQYLNLQQKSRQFINNAPKKRLFVQISQNKDNKNESRDSFYKSKRNLDTNEVQPKDMLKQIQDHLSKTQRKLDQIQRKTSPKKVNEDPYKQIDNYVQAFEEEKQNNNNQQIYRKNRNLKQKNKKEEMNKKYKQLQDSQILQQQQQYIDETTRGGEQKRGIQNKKQVEQVFEDVYIEDNVQIDEEIQV